ncbi:hypothetical protein DUZ99_15055 [Xylanibacillus composti]|uniref:Uncharacterized protein n=1 Tax=Xylanibacillus composti TaxID=1572762 RepID=A0A8J4M419_9BACL|nr:hypothetical protein [Xylanibacillus composti]MDT9726299.1 hypothetical protein [Xylanibacillus composti]GIQ70672.1 hypothetical protein XYCOK13_34960 [Xylanibacillus composti]
MNGMSDLLILLLLVALCGGWLLWRARRWLGNASRKPPIPKEALADKPTAAVRRILEEHGYKVVGGKYRQPLRIEAGDSVYQSRYYVDGFAADREGVYVVKASKPKLPMEWTGSAIRDRLLPYIGIYQGIDGLIYVDTELKTAKKIKVEWD